MLRVISQYKRSQNIILLGIVAILAVGMIIAYGTPYRSLFGVGASGPKMAEPVADTEVVAEIDGHIITAKEYADGIRRFLAIYQNYLSQSPDAKLPRDVRGLRQQGTDKELLRSLLRDKVIEIEAEHLGLTATDEELRNRIREQFSKDGKWVGYEKFKQALERQGTDVLDFERSTRQSLTEEKLKNFITSGVQVSPREIEEDYKNSNTKLELSYVAINDIDFKDTLTAPTDTEIRAYFDSHKDSFKAVKDQRKIRYVYISQDKAGQTIPVSNEDLHKEYNPENQIKSIHVKQIVLSILTPKDEETVKAKATELVGRARGKDGKPGEDFDALARGNSQDTTTAPKGGELGVIERSAVKPGDALESAFTLKVNDISEPIKNKNAFYIFKVTERTSKTFEEAQTGLLASVRNRLSYKKASEFADKAVKLFAQNRDAQKTAAELAKDMSTKEATVNPQDLIRETPFFAPGDDVPEIGSNPSFEEKTSILTIDNEVGEKVGIRGGFAVPQLVKIRKPGGDPIFEEIKDKVVERAKREKMVQMAYEKATKLIAEAKTVDGLKAAAEKMGLKVEEAKEFSATGMLTSKPYPAVFYNAQKAKIGDLLPTPMYSQGDSQSGDTKFVSVAVVGITGRKDADLTKLPEQTKPIEERLRNQRATYLFDSYVDGFKRRMKDAKRLNVYNDVIERILVNLAEAETPGAPVQ